MKVKSLTSTLYITGNGHVFFFNYCYEEHKGTPNRTVSLIMAVQQYVY